jgi:hypothetical protein
MLVVQNASRVGGTTRCARLERTSSVSGLPNRTRPDRHRKVSSIMRTKVLSIMLVKAPAFTPD